MTVDPDDFELAAARDRLTLLEEQAGTVRMELGRLRRDLVEAERELSGQRAAQLLEASERLVLAALQAESMAETAMSSLDQEDLLDGARVSTGKFRIEHGPVALSEVLGIAL